MQKTTNTGDCTASHVDYVKAFEEKFNTVAQRTGQQNRAMHKYLTLVAEAMDAQGMDMKTVIKVPIRPTQENVKETMWRPVMQALYPEKGSTTELSTAEMVEVYENFNRFLGERLGVHVSWPNDEPPIGEK